MNSPVPIKTCRLIKIKTKPVQNNERCIILKVDDVTDILNETVKHYFIILL